MERARTQCWLMSCVAYRALGLRGHRPTSGHSARLFYPEGLVPGHQPFPLVKNQPFSGKSSILRLFSVTVGRMDNATVGTVVCHFT